MIEIKSYLLHYYIIESENITIRNPLSCMKQTPLVSHHNPQELLDPLTRDLYDMDPRCNQVSINIQPLSVFLLSYSAVYDCSASPF